MDCPGFFFCRARKGAVGRSLSIVEILLTVHLILCSKSLEAGVNPDNDPGEQALSSSFFARIIVVKGPISCWNVYVHLRISSKIARKMS
jgi:hypothetical protein